MKTPLLDIQQLANQQFVLLVEQYQAHKESLTALQNPWYNQPGLKIFLLCMGATAVVGGVLWYLGYDPFGTVKMIGNTLLETGRQLEKLSKNVASLGESVSASTNHIDELTKQIKHVSICNEYLTTQLVLLKEQNANLEITLTFVYKVLMPTIARTSNNLAMLDFTEPLNFLTLPQAVQKVISQK